MKKNSGRILAVTSSDSHENQNNPLVKKFGKESRWCIWKFLTVEGRKTKVPYAVNGKRASSTDPSTWTTYPEAAAKSDKVGIVFTSDQTLLGIDIDHCVENGKVKHEKEDIILKLIEEADTYTELSPSGTGLHLYIALSSPLALTRNRHEPFEAYTNGRYFTTTFTSFGKVRPVRTVSPEEAIKLLSLIGYPWTPPDAYKTLQNGPGKAQIDQSLNDASLLKLAFSASNGAAVESLYKGDISPYGSDESRADLALLSHLAFWTGRNSEQMDRVWLASPLGSREKTQKRKEYRERTIATAIANCREIYTPSQAKKKSTKSNEEDKYKSAADALLEILDERKDILLFHDEKSDTFIAVDVDGHREIWPCKSRLVKKWLAKEYWKAKGKGISSEAIKTVLNVLEGKALFEGILQKLNIRFAWHENALWYDLSNKLWQAIKITEDGWEIVDQPPIIFRRYSHALSQATPASDGDARLLLKYVNVKDDQQKLLLVVFLITCFIPDFAHVILVIFGSQGSAKSTLSKLLRRVIDPSVVDAASMPDTPKELIQTLAHHAFLFFDNVSHINEVTSDILCKAVTGSGFPKRELYSDDDDIIYTFKRCIGINGINLVGTRADLLERSLLIELDRIPNTDRKQEKELMDNFERDLPQILGGVLQVLVKALTIKPSVQLTATPRMADFAVWGCAIAEALGYDRQEFLKAYQTNIDKQTEVVVNDNIVASAVISFMTDQEEWRGTATDLLKKLTARMSLDGFDVYEKFWPRASNSLMRRLNELKITLRDVGISFVSIPGQTREVVLKRVPHTDGADDKNR